MTKSKILIAAFTILTATSTAIAQNYRIDFDGALGSVNSPKENTISLKEAVVAASDNSAPNSIPSREYIVDSEKLQKEPAIFLRNNQAFLKQLLIKRIPFGDKGEQLAVLKADATIVLFDSHSVYLASDKFEVFAVFSDSQFKAMALNSTNNNKGMCHTIVRYGKRCAWWANLLCTAWELYEIYEEVCDGDSGGGSSNGGSSGGGAHGPHGNPLENRHN